VVTLVGRSPNYATHQKELDYPSRSERIIPEKKEQMLDKVLGTKHCLQYRTKIELNEQNRKENLISITAGL